MEQAEEYAVPYNCNVLAGEDKYRYVSFCKFVFGGQQCSPGYYLSIFLLYFPFYCWNYMAIYFMIM